MDRGPLAKTSWTPYGPPMDPLLRPRGPLWTPYLDLVDPHGPLRETSWTPMDPLWTPS